MSKFINKHRKLLSVGCLLFVLFGCTSKPTVTFEQMAKWDNGIFVSEFGGFSIEVPENWIALSDSEIKQQVATASESVIYGTPSVSLEQFQKTSGFYPMAFITEINNDSENTFAMTIVIIERMNVLDRLSVKTADEYLAKVADGYKQNQTAGNTFSFEEIISVNIGGLEYRCLPINVESYQYRQIIAARIKDDFVIGILIMTTDNHQKLTEEAFGAFSDLP